MRTCLYIALRDVQCTYGGLGQLSSSGIVTTSEVGSGRDLPCSSAEAESTTIALVASFFPSLLGHEVSHKEGSSFLS